MAQEKLKEFIDSEMVRTDGDYRKYLSIEQLHKLSRIVQDLIKEEEDNIND